jgi:hypothetical protein
MLHKNLVLHKFEKGFRILSTKDLDNKFFVIDDVKLDIGDEFRVGPNGYFEKIGNMTQLVSKFQKEDIV